MRSVTSMSLLLLIDHLVFLKVAAVVELTYEDLTKLNVACSPKDTCSEARDGDGISTEYSCSCGSRCSKLGTCCIDAPHRNTPSPELKPSCRSVGGDRQTEGFLMVDKCVAGDLLFQTSSVWKSRCERNRKAENSILSLAPVTSLISSMTYKNYFCLRCYETTDEFLTWDVALTGYFRNLEKTSDFTVTYDKNQNSWFAEPVRDTPIPVNLGFVIPTSISSLAEKCEPDAISNCSYSWTDDVMQKKCEAYTALVYVLKAGRTQAYKNPHCALCNHESVETISCQTNKDVVFDMGKEMLSFSFPRVNISSKVPTVSVTVHTVTNGDSVEKISKCEENSVYDPYSNKCRKLACAIPGYVVKNGRCSRGQPGAHTTNVAASSPKETGVLQRRHLDLLSTFFIKNGKIILQ